jgi:hypothetical protein
MFLVVLGFVGLMHAQSSTDGMQKMTLSGTVCNSACVANVGTVEHYASTCDPLCTDKTGDAVLVDDQGNVKKIANQDMCRSHMGKHVKLTATPTEKEREDTLRVMELHEDTGGGF